MRIRKIALRFVDLEIWVIALAVAASFVYTRFLPVAVGVAVAFWPVRWLAYGRISVRTPVDWSIALLLLTIPVTLWATALPETTLPQVYRLLTGIALYYAIANWASTTRRLYWIIAGLILTGLALAAIAPFSVIWPTGKLPFLPVGLFERFRMLVSDSVHPNVLAGNLVILMPFALAATLFGLPRASWRHKSWLVQLFGGLVFLAMLVVLILTQSRGAWLGFGMFVMLMALLRWRRGWIIVMLGAIAAGVAIYVVGLKPLLEMLVASSSINTLDGRQEIWSRAIYMIQDFPYTGIGMGTFGNVADLLYPFSLTASGPIPHAHNLFLQVAVDLGIPGLIGWLASFGLVIVAAWQIYRYGRKNEKAWAAGLGAALLCSQFALVVHGMIDSVVWGMVKPAPLVWAIWGLAAAGSLVTMKEASQEY